MLAQVKSKKLVIARKLNVWSCIAIVSLRESYATAIAIALVATTRLRVRKERQRSARLWIDSLKHLGRKCKVMRIKRDVIVLDQDVWRNIANATLLEWIAGSIVNANNARMLEIHH